MKRSPLVLLLAPLLLAQTTQQVEITAEPHHHLAFSNDQVRVFSVEVPAHTDTLIHWHHHDYIYVVLGDAAVTNEVVGKPSVSLTLHDGDTAFAPPAPFAHRARNFSDKPFRNVTVELLQDEKLRTLKSPWDSDRGLDILHGGTAEILWVKDAVRASEYELQPGGEIPGTVHAHPRLLVALTDLDLLLNDPRSHGPAPAPPSLRVSNGTATWLSTGFYHPVVNVGSHSAKFVTLEFP